MQPFADPDVGAVSGNTKVANRRGLLGRWQHLEYVIGFNLDRRLFDVGECMPTVPGAIGAFRREALADVGRRARRSTLAEDTDLTMAIAAGRLAGGLRGARDRLDRGAVDRCASCGGSATAGATAPCRRCGSTAGALRERGPAGKLGRRGLAYLLLFQVLLPLCAPAVDVYAVYGLLFLPAGQVAAVWLGFIALQAADRRLRAAAGPGALRSAVDAAAAAGRLPAADVPGGGPVHGDRADRHPAALAHGGPHRARPTRCSTRADPESDCRSAAGRRAAAPYTRAHVRGRDRSQLPFGCTDGASSRRPVGRG